VEPKGVKSNYFVRDLENLINNKMLYLRKLWMN
jgi:hypothetical protein